MRDRDSIVGLVGQLESKGLSLLVLTDGQPSFQFRSPGVAPLLELVDRFPTGLNGAVVVDLITGLCAARIFVHLRVGEVIAKTMSESARYLLTTSDIPHSYLALVQEIRNQSNTGTCPFEIVSRQYSDPLELIRAMRTLLTELRNDRCGHSKASSAGDF